MQIDNYIYQVKIISEARDGEQGVKDHKFTTLLPSLVCEDTVSWQATLDVNGKMFISALENWVWSIIWWLKGFANGVMPDEDMGGC